MATDQVLAAVVSVREAALGLVREEHGGVRVEDYLTALAAATGEAVIVDAGILDIEHNNLTPGSPIFGPALNVLLSGDAADVAATDPSTVVGVLRRQLVPSVVALDAFPPLLGLYEAVAENVGSLAWGTVATTVPADNQPSVLPIRMAFELRPVVSASMATLARDLGPEAPGAHLVCTFALSSAIDETAGVLAPPIGLRLALEVVFGMAKMVPMPVAAMREVADDR